jgi:2-hydroxychromene-2-carboxylate isomerase
MNHPDSSAVPDRTVIEVYADIWCSFAHIGLRTVAEARARAGRSDVAIVVRSWPLELVNGVPLSVEKTHEHVVELQEFVAPDAFAGFDPAHFPSSTLEALALVARAYRTSLELGERASFLVRDALFEEGLDVGDPAVIARLAARLGTGPPDDADRAQVQADYAEGRQRGVIGSPHFFANGHDVFCPSLHIERGDHGLTIHANAQKLADFLEHHVFT